MLSLSFCSNPSPIALLPVRLGISHRHYALRIGIGVAVGLTSLARCYAPRVGIGVTVVYIVVHRYVTASDESRWRDLCTTTHYTPIRLIHKWMKIE
jgi:hypothetical protein